MIPSRKSPRKSIPKGCWNIFHKLIFQDPITVQTRKDSWSLLVPSGLVVYASTWVNQNYCNILTKSWKSKPNWTRVLNRFKKHAFNASTQRPFIQLLSDGVTSKRMCSYKPAWKAIPKDAMRILTLRFSTQIQIEIRHSTVNSHSILQISKSTLKHHHIIQIIVTASHFTITDAFHILPVKCIAIIHTDNTEWVELVNGPDFTFLSGHTLFCLTFVVRNKSIQIHHNT